ncbi:DUF1329 domain-containing protein [Zestomonas carbonaria]|uniref:DUF1329 domain-containing protein n=1 Tax=Zestomonas carbonaria TaxID=2762745 RepID=A0A7U7ETC3_9GAMM|nr:DUF1329 domain-containing protein [Pseudomonas carbonaria]CAD5109940.1 hypothetical protein PSEWESI4_04256 [Pseudomonas carbonaria]
MNKHLLSAAVLGGFMSLVSTGVLAKLGPDEISRLGQDLTPVGAEKAGNASGSIPAWTGGLATAPAGYQADKGYIDPFAEEQPLFSVTAANMAQYADQLSAGHKAMLEKYPSFRMAVYPTHRTAALPQAEYDLIRQEAATVELADGGNGLLNYQKTSVPFPIPSSGLEVMWNHMVRYRVGGYVDYPTEMVVQSNGAFTPVRRIRKVAMASALGNPVPNRLYYFWATVTSPESLAGTQNLVHEPLDQTKEDRLAWQYNPGQRRVLRAPELSYDTPPVTADGLRTNDSIDMYNGAPNKYEWKLLGKKEMLVPYNTYKLADRTLTYDRIIQANHLNPDLLRYELHRVWVVEATLKPGERHIYAKRVFYVDEDSWAVLAADIYDGRGALWRVEEAHSLQRYDVLSALHISEASYDLQARRSYVFGLANEEKPITFGVTDTIKSFTPAALRRSGR